MSTVPQTTMHAELVSLLAHKAFRSSPEPIFRLVSGQMSRYYVNCKSVTLSPRGMFLVGHLVFAQLLPEVKAAGGLTFGADPIAVATAFVSELQQHPIQAISIRKARKEHGTMRWIEGDVQAGERVAILEDVVTTGGSTLRAIERAREEGLRVEQVVALVDRQEGGLEAIGQQVARVSAIVTRTELEACLAKA